MKLIAVLGTFLLIQFVSLSQATMKNDVVLKTNGDELTGKVQEIGDSEIKFIYAGETLVYTIKKADISKITFSSGRIETINAPKSENAKKDSASLAAHHNKLAILPFSYLINKQDAGQEMTYKVQSETYAIMNVHSGYIEVEAPATTNALLLKAGITGQNVRSFTMGEICNILGVEYVVQGTITQDLTSVSSSGGSYTDVKGGSVSGTRNIGTVHTGGTGYSGSVSSSSSSVSTQNYSTNVMMNIYTDKGETIFSQNHQSFWSSDDAYKVTLNYLLKRTPIYQK